MTIHTVTSLAQKRRRVETRLEKAELVLIAMRRGCALRLTHTRHGPEWILTDGREVSDAVARLVIASASVADCGDALFQGVAAQTFRWWSDREAGT